MKELAEFCRNLKKDFKPKTRDPTKPVRSWSEKDVLNKKIVDTFVMIFRTQGCSWALNSGCSMCGYFNDSMWEKVSDKDMLKQFNTMMQDYSDQKYIKIFIKIFMMKWPHTMAKFLNQQKIKKLE